MERVSSPVLARRRSPVLSGKLSTVLAYLLQVVWAFVALIPFVWLILSSFKTYLEITSGKTFFPDVWTVENYVEIIHEQSFLRSILNSVLVSVAATLVVMLTSSAAGYVFAKYRFWGKEGLFVVLLVTMMVPFAVIVVPLYITIVDMGLNDTLTGVAVPQMISTFGIFMMRQFMESIPDDLLDAARVDGASEWWIFGRLILPLATGPLAALLVFTFLGSWDNFFWPYVALTKKEVWTLPLVMGGLRMMYTNRPQVWCAASVFTIAPVMLVYAVAQRQFIRGIALTGLKM
jgi:ABC-type glycerol-3-phosphate transport system permease component